VETFIHATETLHLHSEMVVLTCDPAAFKARARLLAEHASLTLWQGDVRDGLNGQGSALP